MRSPLLASLLNFALVILFRLLQEKNGKFRIYFTKIVPRYKFKTSWALTPGVHTFWQPAWNIRWNIIKQHQTQQHQALSNPGFSSDHNFIRFTEFQFHFISVSFFKTVFSCSSIVWAIDMVDLQRNLPACKLQFPSQKLPNCSQAPFLLLLFLLKQIEILKRGEKEE